MDYISKKIAIVGFGIEGHDVVQFFHRQHIPVTLFDKKPESEMDFTGIDRTLLTVKSGENYLADGLTTFDVIFRSPVISRQLPEILAAERQGARISSATKLFFELCPGKIIGITGTKGKGTTATLLYKILKKAKKDVYIAGNMGKPLLVLLPKLTKESWVVLELGAPQILDFTISPHIAGVLNITTDHLDWFKTREAYIKTKEPIVKFQKPTDFAVVNADYDASYSFAKLTPAHPYFVSTKQQVQGAYCLNDNIMVNIDAPILIGHTKDLKLRGKHHLENILMAITLATLAGASVSAITQTVFSFTGLEHRLQYIGTDGTYTYYNDSAATNPDATIAAIHAFTEPLTIILGGSDKGLDYQSLAHTIASTQNIETLILIGQTAQRMQDELSKAHVTCTIQVPENPTMETVVQLARDHTRPGGVILLSPAAASFGLFRDYKDRGEQFIRAAHLT